MKTEIELLENALDTTSVNGKKLREYINKNYISNSVLDKIRAEIDKARFIDKDTRHCKNALASGLEVAMKIIDKYKEESEE